MGSKVVNRPAPNARDGARAVRAATKIQARFRGYRVRKQLRLAAQCKRQNGPKNGGRVSSSEDPAMEEKRVRSAVRIQASVRGYLVRKHKKVQERAASTIQSSYRAYRARQHSHEADDPDGRAHKPNKQDVEV